MTSTSSRIRDLNDAMRRTGPGAGRWITTDGVQSLGPLAVTIATQRVRSFNEFASNNDQYSEHDFGSFDLLGNRCFWKIDYYDRELQQGSDDPADAAKTCRVLTIMLAEEY